MKDFDRSSQVTLDRRRSVDRVPGMGDGRTESCRYINRPRTRPQRYDGVTVLDTDTVFEQPNAIFVHRSAVDNIELQPVPRTHEDSPCSDQFQPRFIQQGNWWLLRNRLRAEGVYPLIRRGEFDWGGSRETLRHLMKLKMLRHLMKLATNGGTSKRRSSHSASDSAEHLEPELDRSVSRTRPEICGQQR